MVGKNQIKVITSLQQKKFRKQHELFFVEGKKMISELLQSQYVLDKVYVSSKNINLFPDELCEVIEESVFKKISALTTPSACLATFKIPSKSKITVSGLTVVLDSINDPGNLGTIIRLCDWFGIKNIICSEDTVDVYNPKVLQATMGSVARVNVHYTDIYKFLKTQKLPTYGTYMDGKSVYDVELPKNGFLIFGNEANGISEDISQIITERISIPRFGENQSTESLNVAMAAAILLSEFARRQLNEK
jgi:TrmH family RNA methyltransferase